jgi:electron-transferring-flavoprotein dehydrogenase
VVDPGPLRALFPELDDSQLPLRGAVKGERIYWLGETSRWRIPTPPEMRNHGNHAASLSEIVRWMGEQAEGLGVNIFTGFPAAKLLADGSRVTGVETAPSGLNRDGTPGDNHMPAGELTARVTVLSDGTRSVLAQAWLGWQQVTSPNPQIYALGVKELWETKRPLNEIIHTLGWPLPSDAFGGSFIYPMGEDLISLGLVVGLDYGSSSLDVHELTQKLKGHPLLREYLEGGQMVEWGAKTIPEGGLHALPERMHGDGLLLIGDAAGLVNVAALKGVHYAMQSGIFAAETIFAALQTDDTTAGALADYDRRVRGSFIHRDLRRTRNMRLAFKKGFYGGGVRASLMSLTRGAFPAGRIQSQDDANEPKRIGVEKEFRPDGKLSFSKVDAVFRSGNTTRDDAPSHLQTVDELPTEVSDFYRHVCPAGVYERDGDRLVVNAPNCIDCKATDVLGPRWNPREGGSGPRYKRM